MWALPHLYRDSYNLNLFVKIRNEHNEYNLSWMLEKMRSTLRSAAGTAAEVFVVLDSENLISRPKMVLR